MTGFVRQLPNEAQFNAVVTQNKRNVMGGSGSHDLSNAVNRQALQE
jgi:hypothetical protein